MNPSTAITRQDRATLVEKALQLANNAFKGSKRPCVVTFRSQWPPTTDESVSLKDGLDERPDIDLWMQIRSEPLMPIDIVYLRHSIPPAPETLKTVEELAVAIYDKALSHWKALEEKQILISSGGSKFDVSKYHQLTIDAQGYLIIEGLRIVLQTGEDCYHPIKACELRSHSIIQVSPSEDRQIVILQDDFDRIRTDGPEGCFCTVGKTIQVAVTQLVPSKHTDSRGYSTPMKDTYIPLFRTEQRAKAWLSSS